LCILLPVCEIERPAVIRNRSVQCHPAKGSEMKYVVRHYEGGYQVFEQEGENETLIASFHKEPQTRTGKKSLAQRRAEEYCDRLNQQAAGGGFSLDFD
jgi:hypothetical protein